MATKNRPTHGYNRVDEAGRDSFPASDPPPWNPGRAGEPSHYEADDETEGEFAPLIRLLYERRARLAERFHSERQQSLQTVTSEPGDEGDRGRQESDMSYLDQLSERDQQALREIDAALIRMDTGEYGICLNCDEPIDPKRLVAIPETLLCVACAESLERERHYNAHPTL